MFTIGMLLGLSEILGIFCGDKIVESFPDYICLGGSIVGVLMLGTVIKLPGLDQVSTYVCFLMLRVFTGMAFNLCIMVQQQRTVMKLAVVSFET